MTFFEWFSIELAGENDVQSCEENDTTSIELDAFLILRVYVKVSAKE